MNSELAFVNLPECLDIEFRYPAACEREQRQQFDALGNSPPPTLRGLVSSEPGDSCGDSFKRIYGLGGPLNWQLPDSEPAFHFRVRDGPACLNVRQCAANGNQLIAG
jgi:hypothetical protein